MENLHRRSLLNVKLLIRSEFLIILCLFFCQLVYLSCFVIVYIVYSSMLLHASIFLHPNKIDKSPSSLKVSSAVVLKLVPGHGQEVFALLDI